MNKGLTNEDKKRYNKGSPTKCDCGRVIAYRKEGKIYVKCRDCKKWIAILSIKEGSREPLRTNFTALSGFLCFEVSV